MEKLTFRISFSSVLFGVYLVCCIQLFVHSHSPHPLHLFIMHIRVTHTQKFALIFKQNHSLCLILQSNFMRPFMDYTCYYYYFSHFCCCCFLCVLDFIIIIPFSFSLVYYSTALHIDFHIFLSHTYSSTHSSFVFALK